MLNKELMLASNKLDSKNYTHIVTVGQRRLYMDYGYSSKSGFGSIDTDALNITGAKGAILALHHSDEDGTGSSLLLDSSIEEGTPIYLGRSDKQVNFGIPYLILAEQGIAKWNGRLFGIEDVDKVVPVWLSSSPPILIKKSRRCLPALLRRAW